MAGGIGTRMKSDVPKQFLEIDGIPIIVRSIQKFLDYDSSVSIVVVLPEQHVDEWNEIKSTYLSSTDITLTVGGKSRTESVMSGLAKIDETGLVAIHDAVRPFVSIKTIADSFASASKHLSGVATVALKDSIREIGADTSAARDRSNYVLVQTPQTFDVKALKSAYKIAGDGLYTDDASVFEAAGNKVHLVDGTYDNIKITTPEDLK